VSNWCGSTPMAALPIWTGFARSLKSIKCLSPEASDMHF
jgi:hypothetical protein